MTPGGDGGNTYLNKSEEEMSVIKKKISAANFGKNNGMAKGVKCRNEISGEILYFDTLAAATSYFNILNKGCITNRCNKITLYLYRNIWNFAWENDEFDSFGKFDSSTRKGTAVRLVNIETGDEKTFASINKLCVYLGYENKIPLSMLQAKYANKYIIEKIN